MGQMCLMADRQNAHGAFSDAQNDIHEHFNFCKPPIHGWAVSRMRAARPDFFTPDRLRETLAWLEPWTRWWLNHRLREDGGLPLYLHGNDSGWDNSTFLLIDGLRRGGESALAGDIARRHLRLCARSGFAENFDALTGDPLRDKANTWTSSVFLLLAGEEPPC